MTPITCETVDRVSPAYTGTPNRPLAYPRLAMAFSDTSGTDLPKTTWNTSIESSGARSYPMDCANGVEECTANRPP